MITLEELEEALGDDKESFVTKDVDHDVIAINLLRERIPYEVCKGIVKGAEHDILYLVDADKAIPYLSKEDLAVLADCNVCYDDENGNLFLFL